MEDKSKMVGENSTNCNGQLSGNLSVVQVALLCIASAAPLGAVVSTAPIGFMAGNGAGLAGTYLLAGIIMACFVIGYVAFMRVVPGGGASYRYISEVFGKRFGVGTAWVAFLAYTAMATALSIFCGYFFDLTLAGFGIKIGWLPLTIVVMIIVGLLGRANVDFAARILVPLVAAEFIMLIVLAIMILADKGLNAFPIDAVSPKTIFSPGMGIALMTALCAFIGIEASTLYVQEARDGEHTISRATLLATSLVALIYFLSIWIIVGDIGVANIKSQATLLQGDLVVQSFRLHTGTSITNIMLIMLCFSNFACYLSLHNAATRYMFTLGGIKQLPVWCGTVNKKHGAPSNASLIVSIIVISVLVILSTINSSAPYAVLAPSALAVGTVGILGMQAAVSFAIVIYFRRQNDKRIFKTLIAPLIACISLLIAVILIFKNYSLLTGSESIWVNGAPIIFIIIFIYGFFSARKNIYFSKANIG